MKARRLSSRQTRAVLRMRLRQRLGAHDRLGQVALLVRGPRQAQQRLEMLRGMGEDLLKVLPRFLEEELVQAAFSHQKQQRNVLG